MFHDARILSADLLIQVKEEEDGTSFYDYTVVLQFNDAIWACLMNTQSKAAKKLVLEDGSIGLKQLNTCIMA